MWERYRQRQAAEAAEQKAANHEKKAQESRQSDQSIWNTIAQKNLAQQARNTAKEIRRRMSS